MEVISELDNAQTADFQFIWKAFFFFFFLKRHYALTHTLSRIERRQLSQDIWNMSEALSGFDEVHEFDACCT